jgi:hypothetical protein
MPLIHESNKVKKRKKKKTKEGEKMSAAFDFLLNTERRKYNKTNKYISRREKRNERREIRKE